MLRTIIWFLYFAGYLIFIWPGLFKAAYLKKKGREEELDRYILGITTNWARRLIRLAGGRIHVKGKEHLSHNEPVLIVSNHQGNFDIPVLLGYLGFNFGFISKIEVKKIPLIKSWMAHMGCVFMDRKDRRQAVKSIRAGAEALKDGRNLVIFPEGTRSKGGPVDAFKKGSFKLATKSGVAILPVTIDGSHNMMEANGNKMTPADVTLTISEPIRVHQENRDMDIQQLADLTREQIVSQLAGEKPYRVS